MYNEQQYIGMLASQAAAASTISGAEASQPASPSYHTSPNPGPFSSTEAYFSQPSTSLSRDHTSPLPPVRPKLAAPRLSIRPPAPLTRQASGVSYTTTNNKQTGPAHKYPPSDQHQPTSPHKTQPGGAAAAPAAAAGLPRASLVMFGRPRFSSAHSAKPPRHTDMGSAAAQGSLLREQQFRKTQMVADFDSDSDGEGDTNTSQDLDNLSWELNQKKPWYRRKRAKKLYPLLVSCIFILAGGLYLAFGNDAMIDDFQVWRLCFFIAGLPFVWLIGDIATRLIVWGVENTMFTVQNALYFVYAVRRPFKNVLRAALALGWWAAMMTAWGGDQDTDVAKAYRLVLRIWTCVTLFMLASLIKTLIAKILALKFNKQSHLKKIQESLRKEYLLHLLLQPRERGQSQGDEDTFGFFPPEDDTDNGHNHQHHQHNGDLENCTAKNTKGRDSTVGKKGGDEGKLGHLGRSFSNTLRASVKSLFTRGAVTAGSQSTIQEELLEEGGVGGSDLDQTINSPTSTDAAGKANLDNINPDGAGKKNYDHSSSLGGLPSNTPTASVRLHVDCSPEQNGSVSGVEGSKVSNTSLVSPAKSGGSPAKGQQQQPSTTTNLVSCSITFGSTLNNNSSSNTSLQHSHSIGAHSLGAGASPRHRTSSLHTGNGNVNGNGSGPGTNRISQNGSKRRTSRAYDSLARTGSLAPTAVSKGAQRLSIVMEAPLSKSGKKKVLDMSQLAKMEKYIRKNALKSTFKDELSRVETDEADHSELEAKKLAYYLFWNVKADLSREYLVTDDFKDFVLEEDVEEAFNMIDDNRDGSVTLQECMDAMEKLFAERRDLAVSLKDTKSVVGKLESVIGVGIHIIFVFIYMLVFNVDVMKTYLALSSLVLAFSFIFQNSIRTMYENVVFLFVVHPFDVGDLLQVENETYKIHQIDLLYTIMNHSSGGKHWFPNQRLMAAPFQNISASAEKWEGMKIMLDMDTPATVIDCIKASGDEVIAAMPTEFLPNSFGVSLREATAPLKFTLSIGWKYSHNGVEMGRCTAARTAMHIAVAEALFKFGAKYTWPVTGSQGSQGGGYSNTDAAWSAVPAGVMAVTGGPTPPINPIVKKTL